MFRTDIGPVQTARENRSPWDRFCDWLICGGERSCGRIWDTRSSGGKAETIENHGKAKSSGLTKLSVQEHHKT